MRSDSARDAERRVAALVEMGRLDDALALAGEALATEPTPRLWCSLGYVQLKRGEPEEALRAAEQAIPGLPQGEWPLRLRALALSRLGRRHEAIESARAAVAVEPQSAAAWTMVAELLAYAGDTCEARAAAMRAYELAPDSDYTLITLLYVAGWASDWSLTERVAKAMLQSRPDHPRAIYGLGRAAAARGDQETALELFRRALAAAPGDANLLASVQDTLIDLGRCDEAIDASRRVLEIWPDHARAWCGVAQGACSAGRFDEALTAASRAVELTPDDDFALRLHASALWALGRDAEALDSARRAARDAPSKSMPARPWVALALHLISAGELGEAEAALEQALRLGPHLVIVHTAVARLALARRRPAVAARAAAAALRRDEGDARAHCAAAYAGAARDDWRFARAAFTRAHELDPRYCCARAGLLWSQIEMGERGVDIQAGLRHADETSAGCRCELLARIRAHLLTVLHLACCQTCNTLVRWRLDEVDLPGGGVMRMRVGAAVIAVLATLIVAAGAEAAVPPGSIPVGASWQTNGRVETIVVVGSTAYVGGEFTAVRPSGSPLGTGEVVRNHAYAVNVQTGELLPWDPNTNNTVQSIAVSGQTVYLGGTFGTVGEKTHARVAAVDATTGTPIQAFKAKTNGSVNALAIGATGLYMGGAFTTADKAAANHLAQVDLGTGALVPGWTASTDQKVTAIGLTTDGTRLIVAGNFQTINSSFGQRYIGAVSPATGATLSWFTHPSYPVITLALDSHGVFVAGNGNGGNVASFNPATGQQQWVGGVDGNVQAIAVDSAASTVYVGGHFNNYCGHQTGTNVCWTPTVRDHLMSLDELTGNILPWHPSANGVLGVFAMAAANGTVEAGGDFTKIGGVAQQGFGEFSAISDPTLTDSCGGAPTNVNPVTVTASGSASTGPGFSGYKYQTSSDGGLTWGALRNGPTATVKTLGTTMVRFEAVDAYGNASNWVSDPVTITP